MSLMLVGRNERAAVVIARAEETAHVADPDPVVLGQLLTARAWRALHDGDPGAYLDALVRAGECFERAGDLRNACTQRVNVGYAHLELGGFPEAARALREALEVAERMGLRNNAAAARHNLGLALARVASREGDAARLEEARAVEHEAVLAYVAQGDRRMEGSSRIYLAIILALSGDLGAAEAEARRACEVLSETPPALAQARAVLARTLIDLGRSGEALACAEEAASLLERLGGIDEGEALVRLALGEALLAVGRRDDAATAMARAQSRLMARAATIGDPARRASFLGDVPENARTLELAGA
jgi:tetratricopeptide (TPR) repeat protein